MMYRRLILLLGLCALSAVFRSGAQSGPAPSSFNRLEVRDYVFWGSYYDVANYQATLMLNNKSPEPVTVAARVFDLHGGQRDYQDAIAIKAYNGAPNGHFIAWQNTGPNASNPFWRFNVVNTQNPPFNYVERICLTQP